ncbi:MAG TPA: type VI secretion system tip protein TssI/VgrG [Polyangiaceae bacterium]|nr:type VI secretion system tip protein TssI/VgrG [Polyangiaceae bacterium]
MSQTRVAVVKSVLGDALVLVAMRGSEELGRPFRYELDLTATDPDVDFGAVLGQPMTVELELHDGSARQFTGYVTELSLAGGVGRKVLYRAVLRPWLMLMDYRKTCRIFQNITAPDVIKDLFRAAGFSDFEDRLSESYRTWEYLVQYRESDFAFISRLMEQEGIYYYVRHDGGLHVVVLSDSRSAHDPIAAAESLPYFPPEEQRRDREHIDHWQLRRQIRPGAVAASDFDFTRPRMSLLAQRTEPDENVGAAYEDYDYPGEYLDAAGGDREVRVRLEAHHAGREVAEGRSDARALGAGKTFTLEGFPRGDQNKQYLVVHAAYDIQANLEESGGIASGPAYRVAFGAIAAERPFRTPRATPKPSVEGPQTAIVVGPAGEEIFTDEFGRVKVKFHWDRLGKGDENSSCWVRVSQLWAGSNFGGIHIPRIGQEVIVDFLEGNPDRPIITGRVYNFDNQVPYELPANQTQSGIKSQSSKGGATSNFNELRFEDKLGSEHVYLQAEKDLGVLVKNDEARDVGVNRTTTIGTDDTSTVGHDRTATIRADDTETVGASQSVSIGANQTITVVALRAVTSATENITTGSRTKTVAKNETTSVGGSRSETVGRSESVSIGKDQVTTIGGRRSLSIDKDDSIHVLGKRQQSIGKDDQLQVGKTLVIDAADEIVLKTGSAKLVMKKNGDIVLQGKNIEVNGSGKVNVKASSDVVIKGSKVTSN